MIVYRIERRCYLDQTLAGFGASLSNAGRWNSRFYRLVYTSESRALAMLEVAAHLDINEDLPQDRHYVEIEIPNTLLILEVLTDELPENWNAKPPHDITRRIGDDFIHFNESAVLKVPSCIVPNEFNYLINPLHPDASHVSVKQSYPMNFDHRLHKKQV